MPKNPICNPSSIFVRGRREKEGWLHELCAIHFFPYSLVRYQRRKKAGRITNKQQASRVLLQHTTGMKKCPDVQMFRNRQQSLGGDLQIVVCPQSWT